MKPFRTRIEQLLLENMDMSCSSEDRLYSVVQQDPNGDYVVVSYDQYLFMNYAAKRLNVMITDDGGEL